MAANSRPIVLDVNGKPAPQYYNPTTDAYEYLQGEAGAARAILWGPDGQALSVVNRKLEVRATELEDRLGATTDAAQTNPAAAASQIALLKGLLSQLQGGGSGATPADVIDRAARILGKVSADDGAIAALGALADAVQTDPAQAASVIALLKGLLQTLRTDSAKVQLTGSRVTQTVIARAVRQAGVTPRTAATPPPGTIGALIEHRIWGMTGTFAQDQGARLEIGLMKTYDSATSGPWYVRSTGWARTPSNTAQQVILLYPGVTLSDADNDASWRAGSLHLPVRPLTPIRLAIEIAGTFNAGEGVDSEVVVTWFVGVLA